MTGGGGDSGKCTVEVVVDGAAEVEIRGDNAVLRNLKGQPPQWRRFECNAPLPANPAISASTESMAAVAKRWSGDPQPGRHRGGSHRRS